MMKRMSIYPLIAVLCLFTMPVANGANDCCWDWSPKEIGKSDGSGGPPLDNQTTIWAECVKADTKGPSGTPQDSPCFQRQGRQMVWQGWECAKNPDPSPDGKDPSGPDSGFFCFLKDNPPTEEPQLKDGDPTDPGPDPSAVTAEGPGVDVDLCAGAGDPDTDACCNSGCLGDDCATACGDACGFTLDELFLVKEENFKKKPYLALVQDKKKINRFQEGVKKILESQPTTDIVRINSVQDAIAAIVAQWNAEGQTPINVVIFGHGSPGHMKVGEDVLETKTPKGKMLLAKFIQALRGKIKTLYLYGCSVGQGDQGQAFVAKLFNGLQADSLHAWTGPVYVDLLNKQFLVEPDSKKEVPVPAVTAWGVLVLTLLVLAAGTVVIRRRRHALAR